MHSVAHLVSHLDDPCITQVPGLRASGISCGLKKNGDPDLCLIVTDSPCTASALFTTNQVQAAPVLYDRELMDAGHSIQAVLINSGNANACTGDKGLLSVRRSAQAVGDQLGISAEHVFVMSTGVIGQPLPMDRVLQGIPRAASELSTNGGHDAARAIMTTDTRPKESAVRVRVADSPVAIAGICKGAGMIHPQMATMLAMMATNAAVERSVLNHVLKQVTDQTFNMITVDGDTSTNDTILLLASGSAGNPTITTVDSPAYQALYQGLLAVAMDLAHSILRDGEGATKFVTVHVTGAPDSCAARQVARSIARSSLVKTAIYGQDANWGRVLCAAGYSGVALAQERLSLWLENDVESIWLVKDGMPFDVDEDRAAQVLAGTDVRYRLDMGQGSAQARVWTCDLSHTYVDINAHYRT